MIYFLVISLFLLNQNMDSDWKLKKEKSGIEIYTRSVEGSALDEFKGLTTIKNISLPKVLEVILDVENYENLYPDCVNPKVLKQEGEFYNIHYVEMKAPWPVQGRDGIYEQKTVVSKGEKHAFVTLKPLPGFIAEKKGLVRLKKGTGFWELEEDEDFNVKVTYQYHGEPGGDVPAWLANSFVVKHPLKTIKNLSEMVKK